MKNFLLLISIALTLQFCSQTKQGSEWSFSTQGAIFSHPVMVDHVLYFGSSDSNFYALDLKTQKPVWIVSTEAPVQSKATVNGDIIYFNNDKAIYALDRWSGAELWKQNLISIAGGEQLDPWDYHHGAPVIHGSTIYFGLSEGSLSGFDLQTGEKVEQFITLDSAVVRCIPAVKDDIIYFGDWNGVVYAYDAVNQDTLWSYRTFPERLYATFGQLNSEVVVYDSLLGLGARNAELQDLNIYSGERVWNYISPEGGWISGDPLVLRDTLFIGGSDNHKLFVFDMHTVEMFWESEFLFNNFSKPLIQGDQILITTGDAGNAYRMDDGHGYLYAINRERGKIENFKHFDANVFSSLAVDDQSIYLTSIDHKLHAIDKLSFLSHGGDLSLRGYNSVELHELNPFSFKDSIRISYTISNETDITLTIYDLESRRVKKLISERKVPAEYAITWDGRNDLGEVVKPAYYYFEFSSGEFYQTGYVQKAE